MRLPFLPRQIRHTKPQMLQFLGLNLTANTREGEFSDMRGLSTSNYPLITQRTRRTQINDVYTDAHEIFAWDRHLFVVDNIDPIKKVLKRDEEIISDIALSDGPKAMAVINSKLCVWPDKIYYDLTDDTAHSLVTTDWWTDTWNIVTPANSSFFILQATGIGAQVKPGDVIDITTTGLTAKRAVVQTAPSPSDDAIVLLWSAVEYNPPASGRLYIKTPIPDLDFICSSNNRIWGCNIAENTIYASALGDPADFYKYSAGDIGPYAVTVGTEGAFTGICEYNDAVCVWKEKTLHKIMGNFPSEYYMDDSTIDGVQVGSEKSLTVINQTLYYKGVHGVYAYTGGRPQSISYNLGHGIYTDAVGGTDGTKYYINMTNPAGDTHMYVYDLEHNLWAIEDVENDETVTAMANLDGRLYMVYQLNGVGKVRYINDGVVPIQRWWGEFVPFYENMFNRKGYLRLLIRMDMTAESSVVIKVKEDEGEWKTVWEQSTKKTVPVMVPLKLGRCDKFQLRIEGTGEVTIRAIGREYVTGSVIN